MNIENIVLSIKSLDFVNKLDNLIYEILYSSNGYTSLISFEAVEKYKIYLEKFNNEVVKLKNEYEFCEIESIIQEKREIFLNIVNEHYYKQTIFWAEDVYQNIIDNCLFLASINKNDKYYLKILFNRGLFAISWISQIKQIDDFNIDKLILKFKNDFNGALNIKDSDYLPTNIIKKTDKNLLVKLRDLILENEDEFLQLNLSLFQDKITTKDIALLKRYQNGIRTFKKALLIDEIKLIDSAIEILKLSSNEDKYDFLVQIEDDFSAFYFSNKKIDEIDKVNILKKRIALYRDNSKNNVEYYKKMIIS